MEEQLAVKVGKTPYVRFDPNDYSIPHTHVRRMLGIRADLNQVRVFDGVDMIARHRRSYDRAAQIENSQHLKTLGQIKHQASIAVSTGCPRMYAARTGLYIPTGSIPTINYWVLRKMTITNPQNTDALRARARALRMNGLLELWPEVEGAEWIAPPLQWEEDERAHRSLQRRIDARLAHSRAWRTSSGRGPHVAQTAWGNRHWRATSPARHSVVGHTVLFRSVSKMLGELAALDSDSALRQRLHQYTAPDILVVDEVGYRSYTNRHADLLFELVSGQPQVRIPIHDHNHQEWSDVFPKAAYVASLADRLVHRSEAISTEGESYRLKEALERTEARAPQRSAKKSGARKESEA